MKAIQHQPHKVRATLGDEVKVKLFAMKEKGVICKVTEPTDCISCMVTVHKPGQIRICIDQKDSNKALKRSHYQLPTIYEILPRLSKAKVFSVTDARDGVWVWCLVMAYEGIKTEYKLDEESSFLATFWTHMVHYRRLRMPFGISTAPEGYQSRQHDVLEGLQGVDLVEDGILLFGCGSTYAEAERDHDENMINFLQRARERNLKLN